MNSKRSLRHSHEVFGVKNNRLVDVNETQIEYVHDLSQVYIGDATVALHLY